MNILIDPDSGWRYGFPKPIDEETLREKDFDMNQWLWDNGYPDQQEPLYVRYIETKETE